VPSSVVDEWSEDVIASFCHFIHYFTDDESTRAWTDGPGHVRVVAPGRD